uniref:RRM domain-containing protein n=1 Tax=Meloidogyne incognita TaxID=6306 RepID=A0A914M9E9_MELIC
MSKTQNGQNKKSRKYIFIRARHGTGPRTGFYVIPSWNPAFLATNGITGIYGINPEGYRPVQNFLILILKDIQKIQYSNSNATFESIYNSTEADNTTIYLGGLSSAATEEPIKLAFSEFGIIKEIRLFASQNFGFVVFSDKTSATKAILEMHGKELNLGIVGGKCRLRVKWGKPVQQQQQNNNGKGGDKGWILNNDSVNLALNNQQNSAVVAVAQQQQQQLALASAILQAQQQQQPIFQHPVLMGGVVQQTPTFQQSVIRENKQIIYLHTNLNFINLKIIQKFKLSFSLNF